MMEYFLTRNKKMMIVLTSIAGLILLATATYIVWQKSGMKENSNKSILEANVLFGNGKKEEAIGAIEKTLRKDPNNKEAQLKLAYFYYHAGKFDDFLNFVIDHSLSSNTTYSLMANVYQSRGENDKAEQYYRKAVEIDPKVALSYINFSAYYQGRGDLNKALDVLKQGLSQNEKSVALLISAASVSLKVGDKPEAKKYAENALEIDAKNSQAQAILDLIK